MKLCGFEVGLDQPLWMQYLRYFASAPTGDLGQSYQYRLPVIEGIGGALKVTIPLAPSAPPLPPVLPVLNALVTAGRPHPLGTLPAAAGLLLLTTPAS
mgnify:CR=1 FL=1